MATRKNRSEMSEALRAARLEVHLSQGHLANLLGMSRESVNAWEVGKTVVPIEQRQRVLGLDAMRGASTYDRLVRAFGFAPVAPSDAAVSETPARDAVAQRAAVTDVVRAVADELDVVPSSVRRALHAAARHMRASRVAWSEIEAVLTDEKARARPRE